MNSRDGITVSQAITWAITIALVVMGSAFTYTSSVSSKVDLLKIDLSSYQTKVAVSETKIENVTANIGEIKDDIKDIKKALGVK